MAPIQIIRTRTSSMHAAETTRGAHEFRIVGYTLHKGLGVGSFIRSGTFSVGGFDWCIRYYPDGMLGEDGQGFIAVYVELLSVKSEVRALYEISLFDERTESTSSWKAPAPVLFSTMDMSKRCNAWGVPDFRKKGKLERSIFLHNNCLSIVVNMIVIKPPPAVDQEAASTEVEVPPSDLAAHLGKLLEMETGVDVSFIVQGEVFHAHKTILAARSPVFMAQLYGPVGENNRESITIEDLQPASFKALLHFLYTDNLPRMDDIDGSGNNQTVMDLLIAADKYAMERLKLICEDILCRSLDVQTVAATLSLSDKYNRRKLKDACIKYINSAERTEAVVASEGYKHLKRSCPEIFVELWEEKATKYRKF